MFCTYGANVGSLKLVVERIVEHLQCVWISGSPNYLSIMVAKQGCTKLVSVVSRIPDKLLMVRQITLKITTKKVGPKSKLLT